ncbi:MULTISPECIES: BlaI/MecI/CopY family transcriptional regulator [Gammaproteobacteria]|uniref:BlaI/MecI/CopY family transcriptional regulator n=1 Tax=Gammaproteobacteria TaxID=1236 RepID=UPI000DD00DFB|nr:MULTISPECIES: BlaI/MecI/CopY family transcriptional regulator [Gammaproteobacteria]RTE86596.1 BlaI/MecI/CopY family transcriptional regulator [Aliidiomarina sp. B3213]TCZ90849.1 BlaI/MecI/CopY family transcriptional regulator [Lysobacter sp. N42]
MTKANDISNAELTILKVLWKSSPIRSAEVVAQVQEVEAWHEKTVKTLLNRLVKKGAVSFEKEGRSYSYFPLIAEQDYQKQMSTSLVDRVFSGKISGLVSGFAEQRNLDAEDIESLKQLIDAWEEKQDGKPD